MSNEMTFKVDGQELILERVFNAPRELVFKVFSEAEHLKEWWGPRGWDVTVCHVDFREGGYWHYCMKCMDQAQGEFYGMESWGKAIYKEIEPVQRIEYIDYFSDAEGNISEEMPSSEITMLFEEYDGKTKLINIAKYATPEALQTVIDMGMQQGITETWDRLEEHLEAVQA